MDRTSPSGQVASLPEASALPKNRSPGLLGEEITASIALRDDQLRLWAGVEAAEVNPPPIAIQANAFLAAIVESSDDAIIGKNLNGVILSWNSGAERIFGYRADEAIGRHVTMLIPQDRLDEETEILGKLRRGERIDHFTTVRQTKDGRHIDVSLTVSPIRDSDGRLIGASKVARDISREKAIREALEQSEARYRQLVNSLPAAIYTCDSEGRIELFNEAAVQLWGRTPDIGELWCGSYQIMQADGTPISLDQCPMAIALREGRPVRDVEIIVQRPDGTRRNVLPHPTPLFGENGKVVGAINMLLDITDHRKAQLELAATKDDLALEVQGLAQLHELVMHLAGIEDLPAAMQAILEAVADIHHSDFGLISLYDGKGGRLRFGASFGFDERALARLAGELEAHTGPCGTAFAARARVVVEDTESDLRFEGYRETARAVGFRAVHSTPILTRSGKAIGVISVHFRHCRLPSERELRLSEVCARHAADAVEAAEQQRKLHEANELLEERVRERTAALAQANAKFKAIFDQGAFAGLIALDGTLIDANRSSLDVYGFSRDDVIGNPFWENGWWNRSVGVKKWLKSGFARAVRGQRFHGETLCYLVDGTERIVDFAFNPIKDDNDRVVFVVTTWIDITDRRRAELDRQSAEVLRESESRFRQIADHAPVLMWVHGSDGCEFVNREYLRFVGKTLDEVSGMQWVDLIHPDDMVPFLDEYERALKNREILESQLRFRRADGEYRWLRSIGVPRFNADGTTNGFVGCSIDITDIKRSEEALTAAKEFAEAANQSKDRFLAVLSHELRTPLTPVVMAVAAMKSDRNLPATIREDLTMIHRNVELETKLIDDLLDLSRITSGKLALQREPVSLNTMIQHACETCRQQFVDKGIQLSCDLRDDVGEVHVDPARLQQVLWNVIKNAAKFTPEGGRVQVSTSCTASKRLRVEVTDTGIGIAPENLPRVFEAFEQTDSQITREFGGLGLGLAISKALIELHEGTIRVASEGKGRGTTFTIELPAYVAPRNEPAVALRREEKTPPAALRLLIVEDHYDTARILSRMLQSMGYIVKTAGRASKALELASQEQFDVIVSDVGLPDSSGYELMQRINELRPTKGIAISGFGMDQDIRRSLEAGFSDHITKPVDVPELELAIRRVMQNSN